MTSRRPGSCRHCAWPGGWMQPLVSAITARSPTTGCAVVRTEGGRRPAAFHGPYLPRAMATGPLLVTAVGLSVLLVQQRWTIHLGSTRTVPRARVINKEKSAQSGVRTLAQVR